MHFTRSTCDGRAHLPPHPTPLSLGEGLTAAGIACSPSPVGRGRGEESFRACQFVEVEVIHDRPDVPAGHLFTDGIWAVDGEERYDIVLAAEVLKETTHQFKGPGLVGGRQNLLNPRVALRI